MGFTFLEHEDRRCRICMNMKDNSVYLYGNGKRNLSMKLMKLADVKVAENDGFPRVVCTDCEADLNKCFEFIQLIQWADKMFKESPKPSTEGTVNTETEVETVIIKQECETSERFIDEGCPNIADTSGCDEMDIEFNIKVKPDGDSLELNEENLTYNTDSAQDNDNHEPAYTEQAEDVIMPLENENPQPAYTESAEDVIMPLNHVEIVENRVIVRPNDDALIDPLAQKDPIIQIKSDPLSVPSSSQDNIFEPEDLRYLRSTVKSRYQDIIELKLTDQTHVLNCDKLSSTLDHTITEQHLSGRICEENRWNLVMNHGSSESSKLHRINTEQPFSYSMNKENLSNLSASYNPPNLLSGSMKLTEVKNPISGINDMYKALSVEYSLSGNQNVQNNVKVKEIIVKPDQVGLIRLYHNKITVKTENKSRNLKFNNSKIYPRTNELTTSSTSSIDNSDSPHEKIIKKLEKCTKLDNQYFCLACYVDCGSSELLQNHKDKKPFICRVCTRNFDSHVDLESHFLIHPTITCVICSEVFLRRRDLKNHRISSIQCSNRVECDICHKMISSYNKGLLKHKKVKHSVSNQMHNCIVCEKKYKFPYLLTQHLSSVHTAFENIECDFCKKCFLGPERLKTHIRSNHVVANENIPIRCTVCDQICKNNISLQDHMVIVHGNTVRICEECGKSIKGISAFKRHKLIEHPKTGKFVCKICNQYFNQEILLLRHKKNTHYYNSTIPKPACCEVCGKQFKSRDILKRHKAIHSDEKPFICEVCGASFKQQVALKTHGRVHSSVGHYTCKTCGDSFKWKQTFDKHIKKCEAANSEDDE